MEDEVKNAPSQRSREKKKFLGMPGKRRWMWIRIIIFTVIAVFATLAVWAVLAVRLMIKGDPPDGQIYGLPISIDQEPLEKMRSNFIDKEDWKMGSNFTESDEKAW